jgi:ribosomal protein S12 methylthiotransferase
LTDHFRTDAAAAGCSKGKYSLVSLGCPKNLVDSERMLGLLQLDGYQFVSEPEQADFVIVNTCGFIADAREESFAAIDEMLELKRQKRVRGVIVTGCLAERQRESLVAARPEIDHVLGVFAREEVTRVADRLVGGLTEQQLVFQPAPVNPLPDRDRLRITPRHLAYLKISEGCDRLCTFCAIPKMRGRHASKPIEEILEEARGLADDGVRELIVVAQDTTYYGIDRYGRPRLAELLEQLSEIDRIDWIRLMYLYPMYLDDRLIETIRDSGPIVPYLDMPLQHVNNRVLRRMLRRVDRQATEQLLARLRAALPGLVLRTTLIAGFPSETDAEFEELVAFVQEQRFERLGVFTYSQEPGTPAAQLADQVPEATAALRRDRLMMVQQEIAFQWNEAQVGKTLDILIDAPVPDATAAWVGRSYADAPQIDPVVYVTGERLAVGQLVACEIVAAKDYDLVAVPTNKT